MSTRGVKALVVDDDKAVRSALKVILAKSDIKVSTVRSAESAMDMLSANPFDLVLTDVRMPGMGGLDLLEEVRNRWPQTEVVVMTGYGNVEDAVKAMKRGATDYVIKPVSKNELLLIIERAMQARDLRNEVVALRREIRTRWGLDNIVGSTQPMQRVYKQVLSVAETNALVLIQGETGTGKELFARAIHDLSPRHKAAFVRINCAALPDNLLESELFGHERGAFTGAIRSHSGKFEQAHMGTILLDEIGDISRAMQVKLLHVLESGELQRLGAKKTRKVDVRVIAATNRHLHKEVVARRFRKDLYYRLNVFTLKLPTLRERRDDIPALVSLFVKRYAQRNNRQVYGLSSAAMSLLMKHDWPGNVRELEHVIERAVIMATGPEITTTNLADSIPSQSLDTLPPPTDGSLQDSLRIYERRLIIEALKRAHGVQARAARSLGISRSNLHYRIRKLGIPIKDLWQEPSETQDYQPKYQDYSR